MGVKPAGTPSHRWYRWQELGGVAPVNAKPHRKANPWCTRGVDSLHLPLHAPSVRPILILGLLQRVQDVLGTDSTYFRNLSLATNILCDPAQHAVGVPNEVPRARLSQPECDGLVSCGIARILQPDEVVHGVADLFSVPEPAKSRRRLIADTISENILLDAAPPVALNSMHVLGRMLHQYRCAATTDFRSYFHEFPLGKEVGTHMVFRDPAGRLLALARGPMGHKHFVFVAQATTRALVALALRAAEQNHLGPIGYDIIIDNVMFLGKNEHDVGRIVDIFSAICHEFNVTIGDTQPVGDVIVHRGIVFRFADAAWSVKDEWRKKFCDRVQRCVSRPSVAKVRSLVGMAAWAASVDYLLAPLARAIVRHFVSATLHPACLGPCVDALKQFSAAVGSSAPCDPLLRPHPSGASLPVVGVLATDATPDTVAAVYVDNCGRVATNMRRLPHTTKIAVAETLALFFGCVTLVPVPSSPVALDVVVDNSVLFWGLRKCTSGDADVNALLALLLRDMYNRKTLLMPTLVPSAANPADEESRALPLDVAKLQRLLTWIVSRRDSPS